MRRTIFVCLSGWLTACSEPAGLCYVDGADAARRAGQNESCTEIEMSGPFEDLEVLSDLDHAANVILFDTPNLVSLSGAPTIDGIVELYDVPSLASAVLSSSQGIHIEPGNAVTHLDVSLTRPRRLGAEEGGDSESRVVTYGDLDELKVRCGADRCLTRLHLLRQREGFSVALEGALKIELAVESSDVDRVETLQQIPIDVLTSVEFGDMVPSAYPVLRQYRQWLIEEGFTGKASFPSDLGD